MPLSLIFVTAGNYTIDDNGIPGDNTSVIRDGSGTVIFSFVHPADALTFTTSVPGVNLTLNLTDSLGAADLTVGSLTNADASPASIVVQSVRTTGDVTLVSNGAITEFGSDAGADIIAGTLIMSAQTGIGTPANAIETQSSALEAETNTGGIAIGNFGNVQIGGLTDQVNGLNVATSGDLTLTNIGTILLGDASGTESVRGGNTSGNVTLIASGVDADIIANVDNDAIAVPSGNLALTAGRDIGFGIIGTNFDNDVRASGAVAINAGRDFLIDGFADLASDDFLQATGGGVTINVGRNVHVRSVAGTDGSIFANGNAGADVIITTGANGALVVDPASIVGAPQPLASNSGDVIVNADRILINSASGIGAPSGQVLLQTSTFGREIVLGSASDAAFALELSDAELDRIFTPNLTIGSGNAGSLSVIAALDPANAPNLTLGSGDNVSVQASMTTSSLALQAGNNVFLQPSTINTNTFAVLVDQLGNDNNTGGIANINALVASTAATITGNMDADTLTGTSANESINGQAGNDALTGKGGADTINGGSGFDSAFYSGARANYTIHGNGNGSVTITANGPPDGTDQVSQVEKLVFADVTVSKQGTDFNGDFQADILWRHNDGTTFAWLMNNGQRTTDVDLSRVTNDWHIQDIGDFDGDGDGDILWRNDDGTTISWRMQNGSHLSIDNFGVIPNSFHVQGVGDLDGDGDSDILWRHNDGTTLAWLMQNGQRVQDISYGTIPASFHIQGIGDFDGDGDADILWRHNDGTTLAWRMQNGQRVQDISYGPVGLDWHVQATGDFNGNGTTDILWRNDSGQTFAWLMKSNAASFDGVNYGVIPNTFHVQGAGDFNGDGPSDILWRHDDGTTLAWLLGSMGQHNSDVSLGTISNAWTIQQHHFDIV